jgi:hypothetical protein
MHSWDGSWQPLPGGVAGGVLGAGVLAGGALEEAGGALEVVAGAVADLHTSQKGQGSRASAFTPALLASKRYLCRTAACTGHLAMAEGAVPGVVGAGVPVAGGVLGAGVVAGGAGVDAGGAFEVVGGAASMHGAHFSSGAARRVRRVTKVLQVGMLIRSLDRHRCRRTWCGGRWRAGYWGPGGRGRARRWRLGGGWRCGGAGAGSCMQPRGWVDLRMR